MDLRLDDPDASMALDPDAFSSSPPGQHPRDMYIKLEPEFYTCAFVSPLQLGQQRSPWERTCGECFFTMAMLFVAIMQCITVFGMSAYLVEKDTGYTDEFKLSMALFTQGGSVMSTGTSQDLCGHFSHIALDHLGSSGDLQLADGTTFKGVQDVPMFHSYKMPSGNWVFNSASSDESYMDKLLRVLHDGDWHPSRWLESLSDFRVQYGVLFVIMLSLLWYQVLFELRKVGKFVMVLQHFYRQGLVSGRTQTTKVDLVDKTVTIVGLNANALVVGSLCVTMRFAVACMMLIWGTTLLAASWDKLSLVLNSLAIGIVFELDVVIAYAVVDHDTMERVENMAPIIVRAPNWSLSDNRQRMNLHSVIFSTFMLLAVFVGALYVRSWQVETHRQQLHNAAALCLFAGPTPQARTDLLAPVPGFCESLLSVTCAPSVTGVSQRQGPCVVSDQNMFKGRDVILSAGDELFQNMKDASGHRRSMADWGHPNSKLTSSKTWILDEDLNLFRRVCVQLYQPESSVDNRVIDAVGRATVSSAPFYCPREKLFHAVFGSVARDFDKWLTSFKLEGSDVVEALDQCHQPPLADAASLPNESPSQAPPVPPSVTATPAGESRHPLPINTLVEGARPVKLLRASHRHHRHRVHHEVSQHLIK